VRRTCVVTPDSSPAIPKRARWGPRCTDGFHPNAPKAGALGTCREAASPDGKSCLVHPHRVPGAGGRAGHALAGWPAWIVYES